MACAEENEANETWLVQRRIEPRKHGLCSGEKSQGDMACAEENEAKETWLVQRRMKPRRLLTLRLRIT
ncbi:hypothetical protein BgiMline_009382 [Biomphalaria glabrata]|nr:hypothetical protein BgiMline_023516 [Biomphalaria glabrata]